MRKALVIPRFRLFKLHHQWGSIYFKYQFLAFSPLICDLSHYCRSMYVLLRYINLPSHTVSSPEQTQFIFKFQHVSFNSELNGIPLKCNLIWRLRALRQNHGAESTDQLNWSIMRPIYLLEHNSKMWISTST